MALEINAHVERLRAFQPAGGSGSQLLAENSDTKPSDELTTRAHEFVKRVLDAPSTRMVVLTGDAGHGKTHLCRRIVQQLDPGSDVKEVIRDHGTGEHDIAQLPSGRRLRIVKDLSELSEVRGAELLEELVAADGVVSIVCANEGRLRTAISHKADGLAAIQASLRAALTVGRTTTDDTVHVIDMNHQSVASPDGPSLVRQLTQAWVLDQRKWNICDRCDARPACPIAENRRLLAADEDEGRGASRRRGLEELLRAIEQAGSVVTIRELLIFFAHTLTGGLDCRDVHDRHGRRRGDWQAAHLFHEAAFGSNLEPNERERLEVFRATGRLDPGRIALRMVDDALTADADEVVGRFLPVGAESGGPTPRTQGARREEAARHKALVRFLRRRSFFDAEVDADGAISFAQRLGFLHYDDFALLVEHDRAPTEKVDVRDDLLRGLEAVQGARRRPGQAAFLIVDPAFSSHRGDASVVARQIAKRDIELLRQSEWWARVGASPPDLDSAVDWTDRRVNVVLPAGDASAEPLVVELDARQFEFVIRAARGLVSREFFQAEIRRIMAELALIAQSEDGSSADEITVLIGEGRKKLVIDVGDVVRATEV